MSKNRKTITALTFILFIIFPAIIIGGVGLTYESAVSHSPHPRIISYAPPKGDITTDFVEAIPGVALIVFGYFGAFMMLIKIPTREILATDSDQESTEEVTKISLPVWWLVKSKGLYSKIQ